MRRWFSCLATGYIPTKLEFEMTNISISRAESKFRSHTAVLLLEKYVNNVICSVKTCDLIIFVNESWVRCFDHLRHNSRMSPETQNRLNICRDGGHT